MPLLIRPCILDDAHNLQPRPQPQSPLAPSSSTHYLQITDMATDQIAAYALWIPVPHPSPHRCKPAHDHDPWLLPPSEPLARTHGLGIGLRERLWSSCLYRGARAAAEVRRLGMKLEARRLRRRLLCGKRLRRG